MSDHLPSRGDVGYVEATRDPIFLLQFAHSAKATNPRWHVDSVWFTREEAESFARRHAYRWGRWRVYCTCANGDLAALLKARTNREHSKGAAR